MDDWLPSRPLPFRVLVDEAIRVLRRYFVALYPGIAVPYAIALVPLTFLYLRRIVPFQTFGERPEPAEIIRAFASAGLVFSGMMGLHLLTYAATVVTAMDVLAGRPIRICRSWLWGLRPRVAGTFVLVAICWFGASLFCILPGVYVGLLLSFVAPIMVEEGRFGFAAVQRSARLLRFDTRLALGDNPIVKAFLLMLVAYLLSAAVSMLLQAPFVVVQQVLIMRKATEGHADPSELMNTMAWFQMPASALGALASAAFYLYMNFGVALLFFDVRRRREGRDLEEALAVLEAAPAAGGAA